MPAPLCGVMVGFAMAVARAHEAVPATLAVLTQPVGGKVVPSKPSLTSVVIT